MNVETVPVSNARVAITALDTTPQNVFAKEADGDKGALFVSDIHCYAAGVVVFQGDDDKYATGTITFTGLPNDTDFVIVGSDAYTFVNALAVDYDVLIGATAAETADNLAAAINAGAGEGTVYGTATPANTEASVTSRTGGVLTVRSLVRGTAGNSVVLTDSATNMTVSGATLTGGGSTEYFRVTVAGTGTQSVRVPLQIAASAGLEVKTTGATGVGVTVFYHQPGASGLGA